MVELSLVSVMVNPMDEVPLVLLLVDLMDVLVTVVVLNHINNY